MEAQGLRIVAIEALYMSLNIKDNEARKLAALLAKEPARP